MCQNHFHYKAINRAGCRVAGYLNGRDVDDVASTLRHLNLQPLTIKSRDLHYTALTWAGQDVLNISVLKCLFKEKDKYRIAIDLCRALAELLQSGLPLDAALQQLQLSGSSAVAVLANDLLISIRQGSKLSDAVNRQACLPDANCRVLAIAEKAGSLEDGLTNIAIALEYKRNFNQRLRRSCSYPVFLFLSLGLLIVYLLVALVPELLKFTQGLGSDLGVTACLMLSLGEWLAQWGVAVLSLILTVACLFLVLHRVSQRFRFIADQQLLQLPIIGKLMIRIFRARFFDELFLLIDAGVDLLEALVTISSQTSNRFLQLSVMVMSHEMEDGKTLAQAMRCAGVFTMTSIQSVTIAEQTGDYQHALHRLHQVNEAELSASLEKFEQRVGPVMLAICGLLILWVVLAVIAPIYSAAIEAGALL